MEVICTCSNCSEPLCSLLRCDTARCLLHTDFLRHNKHRCLQLLAHAVKLKEHANELYGAKRLGFAIKKYDRAVALIKRHRNVDTDEQASALVALQVTLLRNLAAAHMAQQARRCTFLCLQLRLPLAAWVFA